MTLEGIDAPFTEEQVENLNAFQQSGLFHPFTCDNRDPVTHPWPEGEGDFGILTATPDGWICRWCDYTQSWAHSFMADPEVLKQLRRNFPRGDDEVVL